MKKKERSIPKLATKKITLSSTGRTVYVRDATMKDQRYAAKHSMDSKGVQNPQELAVQMMTLLIVEIRRANGEKIEVLNPLDLFNTNKILTYQEQNELLMSADEVISFPKGKPKIESL